MKATLACAALASTLLTSGLLGASTAQQQPTGGADINDHALAAAVSTTGVSCDATTDYGDANGIALDAQGNVYTALGVAAGAGGSAAGVEVQKWSPMGHLLATWTTPGGHRSAVHHPVGIAVDVHGAIYVTDPNAGHIDKLAPTGRVTAVWGETGTAPGQFENPAGVTIDRRGDVYVADKGNSRVQVLDAAGRVHAVWRLSPWLRQPSRPSGIAVDVHGRVYIADETIRILVLSPHGTTLRAWGSKGSKPDEFRHPVSIALDPQGRLDIADKLNARIQQFSGTGTPLTRWATGTTGWFNAHNAVSDQPAFPTGVAVAANGTIYTLAGWCPSRVQTFTPAGHTIAIWPATIG